MSHTKECYMWHTSQGAISISTKGRQTYRHLEGQEESIYTHNNYAVWEYKDGFDSNNILEQFGQVKAYYLVDEELVQEYIPEKWNTQFLNYDAELHKADHLVTYIWVALRENESGLT